jgi:hypothetical protein
MRYLINNPSFANAEEGFFIYKKAVTTYTKYTFLNGFTNICVGFTFVNFG